MKRAYFQLFMLGFILFSSCQTMRSDNTSIKKYIIYSAKNGVNNVISKVDTYGAGGIINLGYFGEKEIPNSIRIESPDSSFGGSPYCFLNFSMEEAIDVSGYNAIEFMIKTSDYSKMSMIINNKKGYGEFVLNDYRKELKNRWFIVIIPFNAMNDIKIPEQVNQISFAFPGKGNVEITDVGFRR